MPCEPSSPTQPRGLFGVQGYSSQGLQTATIFFWLFYRKQVPEVPSEASLGFLPALSPDCTLTMSSVICCGVLTKSWQGLMTPFSRLCALAFFMMSTVLPVCMLQQSKKPLFSCVISMFLQKSRMSCSLRCLCLSWNFSLSRIFLSSPVRIQGKNLSLNLRSGKMWSSKSSSIFSIWRFDSVFKSPSAEFITDIYIIINSRTTAGPLVVQAMVAGVGGAGGLCGVNKISIQWYKMINNFLEHEYHPSDRVYTHEITNNSIHIGDVSSAMDVDLLRRQRVRTVVTAAVGMEQVEYDASIRHIVFPLLDMKSQNISKFFNQFYELMEKELAAGSVLVHCAAGISRSATLVISYLMRRKCWGFKESIAFLRQNRPSICPNLGFERQLKEYEIILNKQAESMGFQRRLGSKTSEERKHMPSPSKVQILPEIGMLGRTQLKSKILDPFSMNFQKQSRPREKRPSNSRRGEEQWDYYGGKRMVDKPKTSRSLAEKGANQASMPRKQESNMQQLNLQRLKLSTPAPASIESVMIKRLNLNEKKTPAERRIRSKPLHQLAYY